MTRSVRFGAVPEALSGDCGGEATMSEETTRDMAALLCEGPWCGAMARGGRTVATVVQFNDGATVVRWLGETRSIAVYATLDDATKVHGHPGTEFRWFNRPSRAFEHGRDNATQDACENCPFAGIGGLASRNAPSVPAYVADADRDEWLRGYTAACLLMYGDDWRTCAFGWSPALTIGGAS
jgi:hypothetical protein